MKILNCILAQTILLCCLGQLNFSCAWLGKEGDSTSRDLSRQDGSSPESQASDLLREGIRQFSIGQDEMALNNFEKILSFGPHLPEFQPALLYSGITLRNLKRNSESIERLRDLVVHTEGVVADHVVALYELALSYEQDQRNVEVIATWFDLLRKGELTSHPTWSAEVPMRLGNAYLRIGNTVEAEKYYIRAEKEYRILKRLWVQGAKPPDWAGRLLYNMGYLGLREIKGRDLELELRVLRRSQNYLLEAIEINDKEWADKSVESLMETYRQAWDVIENWPVEDGTPDDGDPDPVVLETRRQQSQKRLSQILNQRLYEVKNAYVVLADSLSPQAKILVSFVADLQNRVDLLLSQRPVGQGLTPEAQTREGVRREGRIEEIAEPKIPNSPRKAGEGVPP